MYRSKAFIILLFLITNLFSENLENNTTEQNTTTRSGNVFFDYMKKQKKSKNKQL